MATQTWREVRLGTNTMKAMVNLAYPDILAYEAKKGVQVIENGKLGKAPPSRLNGPARFTGELKDCWDQYHAPLIEYASRVETAPVSRIFPGVNIPGPRGSVTEIGTTALQVFLHSLSMKQRVVNPLLIKLSGNTYYYEGNRPPVVTEPVPPPEFWPWSVAPSEVEKIQLMDYSEDVRVDSLQLFLAGKLYGLFSRYCTEDKRTLRLGLVEKMLSLIHVVQNPFAPLTISPELVNDAEVLLMQLLSFGPIVSPIPLLFQVESELMYLDSISKRKGLSAFGYFEGSWVAISKVPLNYLFETEMIGVERTVAEISTIINEGAWAPIVIDEHLNNTDGSHRAIAAWVWNLSHRLAQLGLEKLDLSSTSIKVVVFNYFAEMQAQPLVRRETLKVLGHILADPKYVETKHVLFETVKKREEIREVYVILLPERQACCVLKVPFDEEGIVIGLPSPFIYQELRKRGNCAIGERGPYHRTDRNLLPLVRYF